MLKYFFKLAFRNLYRNKLYAVINALGLGSGLAISFIIFSWVFHELNYDTIHRDHERIYRIIYKDDEGAGTASVSPAVKRLLLDHIPEVETSARIFRSGMLGNKTKVTYSNKVFTNDEILYADPEFFEVFSFPLLKGDPETVLDKPNAVVITEKTARKYFDDADPLGKTLTFSDKTLLEVTGVLKNIPFRSHFNFDMLVSMKSFPCPWGMDISEIGLGSSWVFNTYMKIYPGKSEGTIIEKSKEKIYEIMQPEYARGTAEGLLMQPLTDIHLRSDLDRELGANNDIRYVYLFATIALLVILIAGINYVNLTTAYSFDRAREVGIRKILGAHKRELIGQYLGESVLMSWIALLFALILIEVIQPVLASLSGYEFIGNYKSFPVFALLIAATTLVGVISGLFPSLVISSFRPAYTVKAMADAPKKRVSLRKAMVVFQFSISLILLISTGIIYQQLQFMRNKKLGYAKNHVIVLHIGYPELKKDLKGLKNELVTDTRIVSMSAVSQLPVNIMTEEYIDTSEDKYRVFYVSIEPDFFRTMDVGILSGRDNIHNLTPEFYRNKFVLNRTALKEIGWDANDAINREIRIRHGNMEPGPVIGLVEDFHFQSLHHTLRPLVFEFVPGNYEYLLVRVKPENIRETLGSIEATWKKYAGGIPFDYRFLDQEYESLYRAEMKIGQLFIVFAVLSSLIAMLGLFGLASFTAVKRTREIGIRKVFGASVPGIMKLLSGEFTRLVIAAFIISVPAAWFFMSKWLEEFAYRVDVSPLVYIMAGLVVLVLTLLTVGYHSIRAANTNPVDTLRYE